MNIWVKKDGIVHFQNGSRTMCGRPMLGNNWLNERRVMCEECLELAVGDLGTLDGLILTTERPDVEIPIPHTKSAPYVYILEPFEPACRIHWSPTFGHLREVNGVYEALNGLVVSPSDAVQLEVEYSGYVNGHNVSLDSVYAAVTTVTSCRVVNRWGFTFLLSEDN